MEWIYFWNLLIKNKAFLFERRRKIKRKVSNAEKEAQTTISHAQKIIEYFGPKEQLTLTPEQVQKIQNLAQRVKEKLEKKENKKPKNLNLSILWLYLLLFKIFPDFSIIIKIVTKVEIKIKIIKVLNKVKLNKL